MVVQVMFSELVEKSRMDARYFPASSSAQFPATCARHGVKRHHHDGRREPQWGELGAKCESSSEKRVKINETKPKLTSEAAGGAGQLIHAVIVCSLPLIRKARSSVFVSVFMLVQKFTFYMRIAHKVT